MGVVLAARGDGGVGGPGPALVPAAGALAVLACWRCDDVLSLGGLRRAVARADLGVTDAPAASPTYGAPIRLLWLVGGAALMAHGAAALASGEGGGGAAAPLSVALALLAVAWLPLAFVDRARPPLAALGLALPLVAWAGAGVRLHAIAPVSLLLVDWSGLVLRVGRGLFGEPLVVLYDGHCTLCRRTAAVLGTLDVLGQLRMVNMLDPGARREAGVDRFDEAALATDIHVVAGERVWRGFEGYRAICWRLPWYWPVLWVLYVAPVPALGRRAYRRVADSRLCSRLGAPDPAAQQRARAAMNDDRPVWASPSGRAGVAAAVVAAAVTAWLVLARAV
jgi:predicted DCC family thiol-disulfide oxidoreductase YuxK